MKDETSLDALTRELDAAGPGLVGNGDVLRAVLAGCGDCIKILDLDGRLQFMSEGGKRVMEVDDFTVLKGCPWPEFWEGSGNAQARDAVALAKAGGTARFRNHANTAKGNARYWDVQVSPILGADGAPTHLVSVSRDITEEWLASEELRKSAERHQFLAEELTHRVKNTLATVSAIAGQTFKGDAYREGRERFNSRLQTLGAAYNILTEVSWGESDIRIIIESALAPFHSEGRIHVDGPPFEISPARALTLALAINELATNAVKYGALSGDKGRVEILWSGEKTGAGRGLKLVWRESGGPPVTQPTRTGFGSRLIRSMLAQDFGGTVELRYDPSGLVCELKATLP